MTAVTPSLPECPTCGDTRRVEWDWDDPASESVVRALAPCPDCAGEDDREES